MRRLDGGTRHFVHELRADRLVVALMSVALILGGGTSCVPSSGGNALTVRIEGGSTQIAGEGDVVTLRAIVTGGVAPYVYRWSQERGPDALPDDAVLNSDSLTTAALTLQDEYAFRVHVTDAAGTLMDQWVLLRVGPPGAGGGGFQVIIDGPDSVDFGQQADLSAFVGGDGDLTFSWTILSGPGRLSATTGQDVSLIAEGLGRARVQVVVTDAVTELTATDDLDIELRPALTLTDLTLTRVNQAATLSVEIAPASAAATYAWTVLSGEADIDGADTSVLTVTPSSPGTITVEVTATAPADVGSASDTVTSSRRASVVAVSDLAPRVHMQTDAGDILLELNAEKAPLTTANFLRYVDEGFYDGVLIHRYSCERDFQTGECRQPFVIQGGGFVRGDSGLTFKPPTHPPVAGEQGNGLSNLRLTVAMALSASDPDSATTQFFVNLHDDNARLDADFTVFGRVVSGEDVIEAITRRETRSDPITGGRSELLVEPVTMQSVRRVTE